MSRTARRLASAAGATALVLGLAATPGGAQQQATTTVTGAFQCQADGTFLVTFTIENLIDFDLDLFSSTVSGAVPSTPVSSTPDPIPALGQATVSVTAPGSTTGSVDLQLFYAWSQGEAGNTSSVQLPGACQVATTTTTSTTTTSTTSTTTTTVVTTTTMPEVVAAAPVVTVTPAFTG